MKTTPDVFIIESLTFDDEARGHAEGKFISHILKLADRQVLYFYIRTRAELEEVLDKFEDSGFRYLHISCHANSNGIALTLDNLSVEEMAKLLGPCLNGRRVFFSACEIATPKLAQELISGTGCFSVVAPSKAVRFDEAALFWASLYHLLFKLDRTNIKRAALQKSIKQISAVFEVDAHFYSASKQSANGFVKVNISR